MINNNNEELVSRNSVLETSFRVAESLARDALVQPDEQAKKLVPPGYIKDVGALTVHHASDPLDEKGKPAQKGRIEGGFMDEEKGVRMVDITVVFPGALKRIAARKLNKEPSATINITILRPPFRDDK